MSWNHSPFFRQGRSSNPTIQSNPENMHASCTISYIHLKHVACISVSLVRVKLWNSQPHMYTIVQRRWCKFLVERSRFCHESYAHASLRMDAGLLSEIRISYWRSREIMKGRETFCLTYVLWKLQLSSRSCMPIRSIDLHGSQIVVAFMGTC